MSIAKSRILNLSILFFILWSIWLVGSRLVTVIPFSTNDYELYYKFGIILIAVISVIIYTIILIKFLSLLKKLEKTNRQLLLTLASIILIVSCLVLIIYNLLNGVIALIHYIGLVNYSEYEQYQYYLDFVRILFNVIYGGLVTYYVIKMKSELKKPFYLYLITIWAIYLLPYLGNNVGLHMDIWIKESLTIVEIIVIFIILLKSKVELDKTLDNKEHINNNLLVD